MIALHFLLRASTVSRVAFLANLFLGNGKLKPKLRAALEAEGLVLIDEGLPGSVRYQHFRAPGKRFHGKVTGERIGLAISEERFVMYCRSGRSKLVDTSFSIPRLSFVDVSLQDGDTVSVQIDYDQAGLPKVSGQITIRAKTPNAAQIAEEYRRRVGQ